MNQIQIDETLDYYKVLKSECLTLKTTSEVEPPNLYSTPSEFSCVVYIKDRPVNVPEPSFAILRNYADQLSLTRHFIEAVLSELVTHIQFIQHDWKYQSYISSVFNYLTLIDYPFLSKNCYELISASMTIDRPFYLPSSALVFSHSLVTLHHAQLPYKLYINYAISPGNSYFVKLYRHYAIDIIEKLTGKLFSCSAKGAKP
jgi:hypothetical protein